MIVVKKDIDQKKIQQITDVLEYLGLDYSINTETRKEYAASIGKSWNKKYTVLEVKINGN